MSKSTTKIAGHGLYEIFSQNFGDDRAELHNWLLMDTWDYKPALWLIAGVIPTQIYEGFGYFKFEGGLLGDARDERMDQIDRMIRLWLSNPNHPHKAKPQYYFDWAEQKGIYIYWLAGAKEWGHFANKFNDQNLSADEALPTNTPPAREKVLNTSERNTLLKLVIGMAVKGYSHDPAAARSKAPKEIADDLADLGINVTDDTVRKYLKEAANTVLPTKPVLQ